MKPKDEKKPESKGKRLPGSRIAAIVALVVLIAAGVAAGVTYQMELWGGKVVPDVTGMTQADATYMLQNKASRFAPQPFPPIPPRALSCSWTRALEHASRRRRGRHPRVHFAHCSQGGRFQPGQRIEGPFGQRVRTSMCSLSALTSRRAPSFPSARRRGRRRRLHRHHAQGGAGLYRARRFRHEL